MAFSDRVRPLIHNFPKSFFFHSLGSDNVSRTIPSACVSTSRLRRTSSRQIGKAQIMARQCEKTKLKLHCSVNERHSPFMNGIRRLPRLYVRHYNDVQNAIEKSKCFASQVPASHCYLCLQLFHTPTTIG